jgi:hypothetical protein
MTFTTRPLDLSTWSDFAKLAEEHNGVWAGCWCLNFDEEGREGARLDCRAVRFCSGAEAEDLGAELLGRLGSDEVAGAGDDY